MSMISFLKWICWFCYSPNIFSNQIDHYCLISINYFLRNGVKRSQKRTFVRRQWAQNLPFLLFTQHFFQSFWLLLFDVNQSFSQKWSQKLLKANFCSKTVGTVFAVFVLHSTSFKSIWSLLFDVKQLFSQKWSLKLSKANFCSKTVGTAFAVFVLHSTSFPINLIIIVWC